MILFQRFFPRYVVAEWVQKSSRRRICTCNNCFIAFRQGRSKKREPWKKAASFRNKRVFLWLIFPLRSFLHSSAAVHWINPLPHYKWKCSERHFESCLKSFALWLSESVCPSVLWIIYTVGVKWFCEGFPFKVINIRNESSWSMRWRVLISKRIMTYL